MGVIDAVRRWALGRPHVLVVGPDDGLRLRVQAAVAARGWVLASTPADTDALVVAGAVTQPEAVQAVEVLWSQVAAPRARAQLHDARAVEDALDDAARSLHAAPGAGPADPWAPLPPSDDDHHDEDHGDDHGDHGSMMVRGLAMASTAPDRDGLELDVLRTAIGPWLVAWPGGLVVDAAWAGDVLTDVSARWVQRPVPLADPRSRALDVLARVLTLSGPRRLADRARAARDAVVLGAPDADARAADVAARVRRARVLRWSLGGGRTSDGQDVAAHVRAWCDVVDGAPPPPPLVPDDLAGLLEGTELAAARLLVASAVVTPGPHVGAEPHGGSHGGTHGAHAPPGGGA